MLCRSTLGFVQNENDNKNHNSQSIVINIEATCQIYNSKFSQISQSYLHY